MAELFLVPSQGRSAPPDVAERARALDTTQSWIVEAPAGSGKTGLLIQRYLKLLASDSVEAPEQVLAITFTNKATAELLERILTQLEAAASTLPPENEFDRVTRPLAVAVLERDGALRWDLIHQPGRLNIRTIDSVCGEIARALPILSGHGGRQSPVEDAGPLYALASRRTLMRLGGTDVALDDALRLVLLHRDGSLAECESLIAAMLASRDQWAALVPLGGQLDDAALDATILPRLERALDLVLCTAITQLARTIPQDVLEALTVAAAEMATIEGYGGKESPITICAGRFERPGLTAPDLAHWRALVHLLVTPSTQSWRKSFNANHVGFKPTAFGKQQLTALIQRLEGSDDLLRALCGLGALPPAAYPPEQWVVAKALFRILNHALAELKVVFAERGECDFSEIALAAKTALGSDEAEGDSALDATLDAALGHNYQHLLVDEMQDTSSSQYELIERLTRTWDGHSQTVFLVGDPKQSIYLFRQARVERFLRSMHAGHLGDLPLGVLRLTANFRSQAGLVKQFNADFAQVFPAHGTALRPEEVPFVAAAAVRPPSPSSAGRQWHPNPQPAPDRSDPRQTTLDRQTQRREEAVEICRILEAWRSRPLPAGRTAPWKIAVLVRSRTHLAQIVPALKHAGIPFRAVEIDALDDRQEVLDLFALTRALLHPSDRVAWFAVLRAPWCGLPLSELHTLSGTDDPAFSQRTIPSLIAERGELLTPESIARLERLWPILRAADETHGRLTTAQRVERTWRALGGDAYLTSTELANAAQYLALLEGLEEQSGGVDLAQLERRLDALYAAPSSAPDAIDIMTIHKAKGLEWDLVLVPALERQGRRNSGRLLDWLELDANDEQAAHVLLAPIRGKGEDSRELNAWIAAVHNEREAAERKRLFYVACTRAREELHLFASPTRTTKGEIRPSANTLLHSAWPAAESHFATSVLPSQTEPHESMLDEALSGGLAEPGVFQVAAGAEPVAETATLLYRLPLDFDPAASFRNAHAVSASSIEPGPPASTTLFDRPQGDFAARAFGNAVHSFLDSLAHQLAAAETIPSLLASLPVWAPRIAAVLRGEGLPPAQVARLVPRVLNALAATLNDPEGAWLLSPRPGAASEYVLTTMTGRTGEGAATLRLDRLFFAGAEPLSTGDSHVWIVDYKTTHHGTSDAAGITAFLNEERRTYAPQLEAYDRILRQASLYRAREVRVALYYPLLPHLLWWQPEDSSSPEPLPRSSAPAKSS
jgi:ATP-dependent helicase/nuclease subunit A